MAYQYTGSAGMRGLGAVGLGLAYNVKTPVGDQRIDIPVEKMAKDAAEKVMAEIQPVLQQRLKETLPGIIATAWPPLQKKVEGTVDELRKKQLPIVLKKVNDDVVNPALVKAAVGGAVLVGALAGAMYFLRKKG